MFQRASSLSNHRNAHRAPYECPLCGKQFQHRLSLTHHKMTHQGKTQCSICLKVFSRKYAMKRHMVLVEAAAQWRSGDSAARLLKNREMAAVRERRTKGAAQNLSNETSVQWLGGYTPQFPCEVCGRVFHRSDSLAHHKNIHTGKTRCPICHQLFTRKYTMMHHIKVMHNSPVPEGMLIRCEICQQCFQDLSALSAHLAEHRDCHKCPVCMREFSHLYQMTEHLYSSHDIEYSLLKHYLLNK
uniref:C2H2-type domain-containing protein n=1 Tax=Timema cristinae TaxID=61476 RepID=A0A7R9H4W8_TIMCR|nr:unnamed protein product [Timema cristinae]